MYVHKINGGIPELFHGAQCDCKMLKEHLKIYTFKSNRAISFHKMKVVKLPNISLWSKQTKRDRK
jgi:hypothetical protein